MNSQHQKPTELTFEAPAKAEQWKAENISMLKSSNTYVKYHGLPLDEYRQF